MGQGKGRAGSFEAGATLCRKQRREEQGEGLGATQGLPGYTEKRVGMTGTDGEAGRARE